MFQYRPPWAAAMAIQSARKTHLRRGWSAGLGYHPWCDPNANLKKAFETQWVSVEDIRKREVHDSESKTDSCETCCRVFLNEYNKH